MPQLVQPLPPGPLAIVGDVHGEIEALDRLLERLAADATPRTLVFVGDLVDRGPDSVAVVRRVAALIAEGRALATLGNHELNILLGDRKEGNGWFFGHPDHAQIEGAEVPFDSVPASPADRDEVLELLRRLPLVLERDDVRVVHAGYSAATVARLPAEGDPAALSKAAEQATRADLAARGVPAAAAKERAELAGLRDQHVKPDRHLAAVAEEDSALQLRNPVKLLTSGAEVPVAPGEHFFVGGKWRFVCRDRWWREPVDRPTVVGHYWRRRGAPVPGKVDVWDDVPPFAWSGDVFCVDYSVGRRFAERHAGRKTEFTGGLGALLWPERTVVFDDRDETTPTAPPR
ncbi:MAG: metallophosphoesterase [Myxococcales bacterium]|jgi:hypothetical protein|nr:metallophosphoesterase [Myxococcales bacterium]MBL0198430.1 metallophosphoesterase [Myxococcales bacterium]